jgi:hypothetical protein
MSQSDSEQSLNYRKGVALVGEMLGPQFQAGMLAAAGSGAFAADCAAHRASGLLASVESAGLPPTLRSRTLGVTQLNVLICEREAVNA